MPLMAATIHFSELELIEHVTNRQTLSGFIYRNPPLVPLHVTILKQLVSNRVAREMFEM